MNLQKTKDAVMGFLIIAGAIGSLYNGLAPEVEARWAYTTLAPDIDMALDQVDQNAITASAQDRRIVRLEERTVFLQRLLIGQLAAQGLIDREVTLPEPPYLDKIRDEIREELKNHSEDNSPPPPLTQRNSPTKRRKRPKAPWKQQSE